MDIGAKLAELDARLKRMERASRLSSASLDGTALEARDDSGSLRAIVGQQADGTSGIQVVNGPPPPAPSTPIVASVLGGVTVSWDGTFAGGAVIPLDWSRIEVHASSTSGFTPTAATLKSTVETAQGATVVVVTGGPVYVQLLARNTSGAASPPSAQAGPYGPTPVVASDVLDGIITTTKLADDAVTSAKVATGAIDADALAAAAVTAAKLAANAVTSAAVADGAIGSTEISDGAITTPKLTANAVTANEIAANAITAAKIATNAVIAGKIDAGAVTAGTLAAAAVQAGNLAASAVQAGNVSADAIQAGNIAASAVTARELAALAVTTAKLDANAVTTAKLAAGSVDATALKADAITGKTITGGTITGTDISGSTITGGVLQTNTSGSRVVVTPSPPAGMAARPTVLLYSGVSGELFPAGLNSGPNPGNSAQPTTALGAPITAQDSSGNYTQAALSLSSPKAGSYAGRFQVISNNPTTSEIGYALIDAQSGTTTADPSYMNLYVKDGNVTAKHSSIYVTGDYVNVTANNVTSTFNSSGLSVTGGITASDTAWNSYTPTINNAGSATWTTRNGWWYQIGKVVYVGMYLQAATAGSGTGNLTISLPSTPYRSGNRQRIGAHVGGAGAGTNSTVSGSFNSLIFVGGSGALIDRLTGPTGIDLRGDNITTSTIITIDGWYREA